MQTHFSFCSRVLQRAACASLATALATTFAPRAVTAQQATPHDSFTVQSKAVGEPRLINVFVPPKFRTPTGKNSTPLPVLYMPDGAINEDFPHVVHMVDSLITAGAIRPVIVVGIPNTQRRRDLTGPTRVASDSAIAPRVGGSAAFRQFIRDELIPEIDKRYRTTRERSIIGESLAGLFIVETFVIEPTLFTRYIALDPSVWWNAGALVDSAPSRFAKLDATSRSLYMATSGEPSTYEGTEKIVGMLRATPPKNLRLTYLPRRDLTHANIFSSLERVALMDALR